MIATPMQSTSSNVVWVEDDAEWRAAIDTALEELGLSYEQLAEQARTSDFTSLAARRLWVIIGGTRS